MTDQSRPKDERLPSTDKAGAADARAARRRFLKLTGAAALAVPVIESVTGKDLLTVSAQAQTAGPNDVNGAFTGTIDLLVG